MNWINIKDKLPPIGKQVMLYQEFLNGYHITTGMIERIPVNIDEYKLLWVTPLLMKKLPVQNVEYWAEMPSKPIINPKTITK